MNANASAPWRLFVDPVGANSGLGVWACFSTVRFHVNTEQEDLVVDFLPEDTERFFQSVREGLDGLLFGCVQDDRGISLGSLGVVFSPSGYRVPVMDFLLQFDGREVVGQVRPDALDAWIAGLHDALVYANDVANPSWRALDNGVVDAALAASALGLSPLTPLRGLSYAMAEIDRRQSA